MLVLIVAQRLWLAEASSPAAPPSRTYGHSGPTIRSGHWLLAALIYWPEIVTRLPTCKGSGTWSPVSVQGRQESQCCWAQVRCAVSRHGACMLHMFYLTFTEALRSNNISIFAVEKTKVV